MFLAERLHQFSFLLGGRHSGGALDTLQWLQRTDHRPGIWRASFSGHPRPDATDFPSSSVSVICVSLPSLCASPILPPTINFTLLPRSKSSVSGSWFGSSYWNQNLVQIRDIIFSTLLTHPDNPTLLARLASHLPCWMLQMLRSTC